MTQLWGRRIVIADTSPLVAAALAHELAEVGDHDVEVLDATALLDEEPRRHASAPGPLLLVGSALLPEQTLAPLVARLTDSGWHCLILLEDTHPPALSLLEAGALGFVPAEADGEQLRRTVGAAIRGEACIPRNALSGILRALIERRRANDSVSRRYRSLSRREREVLGLLAHGHSTDGIARRLVLTPATVRSHLSNLMSKLEVRSQVDAVQLVHEHGLLETEVPA